MHETPFKYELLSTGLAACAHVCPSQCSMRNAADVVGLADRLAPVRRDTRDAQEFASRRARARNHRPLRTVARLRVGLERRAGVSFLADRRTDGRRHARRPRSNRALALPLLASIRQVPPADAGTAATNTRAAASALTERHRGTRPARIHATGHPPRPSPARHCCYEGYSAACVRATASTLDRPLPDPPVEERPTGAAQPKPF